MCSENYSNYLGRLKERTKGVGLKGVSSSFLLTFGGRFISRPFVIASRLKIFTKFNKI